MRKVGGDGGRPGNYKTRGGLKFFWVPLIIYCWKLTPSDSVHLSLCIDLFGQCFALRFCKINNESYYYYYKRSWERMREIEPERGARVILPHPSTWTTANLSHSIVTRRASNPLISETMYIIYHPIPEIQVSFPLSFLSVKRQQIHLLSLGDCHQPYPTLLPS